VRDSLKRRFRDPALADKIAKLDKSVRESRFQLEQIRKSLNTFSKEMARAGVVDDAVKQ
jgi:seryl-tRNA synthetase